MTETIQMVLSPEIYAMQVAAMKKELEKRDLQINDLETRLEEKSVSKQTRKKQAATPYNNTYSDFKSDGKRKPHPADSIRSYSDFKAIQEYFWKKNDIRDWMMWTIGVSLGLRISDLLSLRFAHFISQDKVTIKPRIEIYEQKTGKLNNLLITEAVKLAIMTYIKSIKYTIERRLFMYVRKKYGI